MNNYQFTYVCENGFTGTEIVPAVNSFMAWESFNEICKEYNSPVARAECQLEPEND